MFSLVCPSLQLAPQSTGTEDSVVGTDMVVSDDLEGASWLRQWQAIGYTVL